MRVNDLRGDTSSKCLQFLIVVLLVDNCTCSSNQSIDLNFFSALVHIRVETNCHPMFNKLATLLRILE